MSTNLENLNKVLSCNTVGKDKKRRKVADASRRDAVAEALAKCNSTAEIAALGIRFGLSEDEVKTRAQSATNFGLYRMTIGNRIRGVVSRIQKASRKGMKLSNHDAAYPPKRARTAKPAKKTIKPVKKVAKKVAKKTARPTKKVTTQQIVDDIPY